MGVRPSIEVLLWRRAESQQFPTHGETLFVDLEREEVRGAYIPREVVYALLGGRLFNWPSLPGLDFAGG